ncbi:MAG: septum formation protein Maf [Lentisphaeria bacterium]|nr:septum formation protein Maf [Lentisphaeria bacterium]
MTEEKTNLFPEGISLVLASASPRRKALLEEHKIPFRAVTADAEEISVPGDGESTAKRNALAKAEKVFSLLRERGEAQGIVVLGADTVIEAEGRVLGKPLDIPDAERMLSSLAGKTHKVITGMALVSARRKEVFAETTCVTFRSLSLSEIRSYMEKVHVLDKAGAYGAQEHGEMLIEKMEGSMENVVGLPVEAVVTALSAGVW